MHVAAQYDHSDLIPILLNAGAEINVRDNDGRTPLHIASYFNKEKELLVLLHGNPNVHLKGIDGMTAMDEARQQNHPKIIFLLSSHMDKLKKLEEASSSSSSEEEEEEEEVEAGVLIDGLKTNQRDLLSESSRKKINVELWCQCGKDKGDVRRVLSLLKGGADPNRPYAVSYRVIYVYISKLYTYQVSLASSLGWLYIFTYGSISWSPQSNTIPLEGWFEDRCAK